ncbi:hypothetical protein DXG01_003940 [Tephrocybe rancida]|nr:hypothetical protein DXG01_003940 [Tephrocybe rancida]
MPEEDWPLEFAAAYYTAIHDSREAPWYGLYAWVLANVLFLKLCGHSTTQTTVTYAQYPLRFGIDTEGSDDLPLSSDDEDDVTILDEGRTGNPRTSIPPSMQTATVDHIMGSASSPVTPERLPVRRASGAPSPPDSYIRLGDQLANYNEPETPPPPRPSTAPRNVIKRLTRIPDFVQLLHTRLRPHEFTKHALMLVEIKKRRLQRDDDSLMLDFVGVLKQTQLQAMHAFLSDPLVDTVGVIVAIGECWQYVEYDRCKVLPPGKKLDFRPESQQTYSDGTSQSPEPVQQIYRVVKEVDMHYDEMTGYHVIGTPGSDMALLAVREQMLQMAQKYP